MQGQARKPSMSASHARHDSEGTSRPSLLASTATVEPLHSEPQSHHTASRRLSSAQSTFTTTNTDFQSPLPRPNTHRRGITSIALPHVANLAEATSHNRRPRSVSSPKAGESPLRTALTGSYFAFQPGSSGVEARSPAAKRPPASRSSHGIETSSGPPPALSTRRNNPTEQAWRRPATTDPPAAYSQLTPRALANLDAANTALEATPTFFALGSRSPNEEPQLNPPKGPTESVPNVAGNKMATTTTKAHSNRMKSMEHEEDSTLCDSSVENSRDSNITITDDAPGNETRHSHSSQEDLFLNLACADAASNGNTNNVRSSKHQQRNLDSTGYNDRQYAASAHPLDQRRLPRVSSQSSQASFTAPRATFAREESPELPQFYTRRPPVPESTIGIPSRAYRQSNLSRPTNDYFNSSPLAGRSDFNGERDADAVTPRAEDTESTVSTTAPSTVWDELEDVKSRLRKLELDGKMPPSSEAAISKATGERPRTATTTVTTMSPSPKRDRAGHPTSPGNSVFFGPEENKTYPLLTSALAKSKTSISSPLYRALEVTVTDAIAMARSTSGIGMKSSVPNTIDRQLKRKADNMCRSLTELCIALTEEKPEPSATDGTLKPESRDTNAFRQLRAGSVEDARYEQVAKFEPESTSSSKVLSRLEARRSSLLSIGGAVSGSVGTRDRHHELATPTQANSSTVGLSRTSTALHRLRRNTEEDGETTARAAPRTMTEYDHPNTAPRQFISREYMSQHPMHSIEQRSPSVQSSLPVRKSYFSGALRFPSTPIIQPGNRRYLDFSTPLSADSVRSAEARQQRLASLGQYTVSGRQLSDSLSRRLRHSSLGPVGQSVEGRER